MKKRENMELLYVIYVLVFLALSLFILAVFQLKMAGLNVKDFWKFIEANEMLDKLYEFSIKYNNLSTQEQIVFLMEAEKVFSAFEKVPDMLWEEEYQKYMKVLDRYKDIKIIRWNQS